MPSNTVTKLILDMVSLSGVSLLSKPLWSGVGGILMLHRVKPSYEPVFGQSVGDKHQENVSDFTPNSGLTVTPQFLDALLCSLATSGFDFVDLDEAIRRIKFGSSKPFISITLDDGYKDNSIYATPVFKKYKAPYTIFVAPGLVDGRATLWWEDLEYIIRDNDKVELKLPSGILLLEANTVEQKNIAYEKAMQILITDVSEFEQRKIVSVACKKYKFNAEAHRASSIMDWTELKKISNDGLCTLGAHTLHHYAVARLSEKDCKTQLRQSADEIKKKIGKRPEHFAYPYGYPSAAGARDFKIAKELGFKSAVTTRHGVCYQQHCEHLMALPRISINGNFQKTRYLKAMLSGATTLLFNKGKKLNVG